MSKAIRIENLRTFLEELERRYGKETYTKQEIDEKLKAGVDLKDIAERIPNFRYWLKIKQSPHQTITATCEGKEYTADVLIEKGKTVTLAVKADVGYIAGTLLKTELTITEDTEITATEAKEVKGEVEAGSLEIPIGQTPFPVPAKVYVLQVMFCNATKYIKTTPGAALYFNFSPADRRITTQNFDTHVRRTVFGDIDRKNLGEKCTVSWSEEINSHAWDIEL